MKTKILIAFLSVWGVGRLFGQTYVDTLYLDTQGIDAYTNSGATTTNYGTDTSIWAYYDYGTPTKNYYAYLKTDFSSIPSNAIVMNAEINLYALEVNNSASHSMQLQRLTTTWTETGITWATAPSATGIDAVTMTHDATSTLGWQTFNMTKIARYQVTNPTSNFGIRILQESQTGTVDKGVKYASGEHANSNIRPYVVLEYYIPPHDTIYFSSYKDARVYSGQTSTNYGQDTLLSVFWDSSSKANRTFLYADLSHIPKNSQISIANINLYALSVDNSVTHPMYVEGVDKTSWSENSITWANQPTVWSSYRSGISDAATNSVGWQQMSVINLAKYAVWSPEKNFGWRIALQGESGVASKGVKYASSEHSSTSLRPYLFIEYLPPIEIEGYVTHCRNGYNDGSIHVASIVGGCTLYTNYNWRKVETGGTLTSIETGTDMSNIDVANLQDGLYILEITDYRGITGYKYFFVGEENTTTQVVFEHATVNRAKYTEDSYLVYTKSTGDSVTVGGSLSTFGCYTGTANNSRSVIQYQVDWDPSLVYTRCDQTVTNKGSCYQSATSDNDAWVSRVTEPWGEFYATWATHPDVTTQDRIYVPTTTTNGYEARNDTFNVLPFVPHWQSNQDENYGFELALATYNQPALASRDYNSSDQGIMKLFVNFTVKPKIETVFHDSLGLGDITVNAPAGELPFTYLIGYDTIPDLVDLWNEVKDSIAVDSITFIRGKSNTRNYTFDKLPAEHYFLAVFDNDGNKLYDTEVHLGQPTILSYNYHLDNDSIKVGSGYSTGYGSMDALVQSNENGAFEFEISSVGDFIVGFNYNGQTTARTASDFEFGIELNQTTRHFKAIANGTNLYEDSVVVNDIFRIAKENYELVVYRNEYEVYRYRLDRQPTDAYKIDVTFTSQNGLITNPVKVGKIKTPKAIFGAVSPAQCPTGMGSIKMKFNTISFPSVTGGSYEIINASSGTTIESGTFTFPNSITEYLAAGDYKVIYTTTGSPAISWVEYFTIGQPVLWDFQNAYFTPIGDEITTNTSDFVAEALSENILKEEEDEGFVTFRLGIKHYYPLLESIPSYVVPLYSSVSFIESDGDQVIRLRAVSYGVNIITKYIEVYDESNALVNTPFATSTDGIFKIKLYNDTLKTYYNNSVSPFAYVVQPTDDDYRVKATSFCGYVKSAQVDFCYGSTTSELCAEPDYDLNGNYYVTNNGYFCFIYNQEYNDPNLTFNIYNRSNVIVANQADFTLNQMILGENRVVLDFTNNGVCLGKGYFVLEIINSKNEKFYLRFYNNYLGCLPVFGAVSGIIPTFE